MAINAIPPLADRFNIRRQNIPGDAGAAPSAPVKTDQPRPDARLAQAMQAGRETSALLSTLPGPNLSFFQAPSPLQASPRQEGFAAAGTLGAGPGQRLNVPLQEAMQTGRETSALLSTLMGPNERAFPAPLPPAFAPQQGGVPPAATSALPRAGAQLLETEQAGKTTSALLSGLMAPGPAGGLMGAPPLSRPSIGGVTGNALAAMRTAEQVMQAVGTAAPSAQNMRIANEAYQMETQAQREVETRRVAGKWEWLA
ncbi:MAG TPA: hypothetical protein VMU36_02020 [Spirochaetia bacterium]|nr:hypothetical protein [Spirochaetia bacterium]